MILQIPTSKQPHRAPKPIRIGSMVINRITGEVGRVVGHKRDTVLVYRWNGGLDAWAVVRVIVA